MSNVDELVTRQLGVVGAQSALVETIDVSHSRSLLHR